MAEKSWNFHCVYISYLSLAQESRIACRSSKFLIAEKTMTNRKRSCLEAFLWQIEFGQIRVVTSWGRSRRLASRVWFEGQTNAMAENVRILCEISFRKLISKTIQVKICISTVWKFKKFSTKSIWRNFHSLFYSVEM